MILRKIKLENFRQFKGAQELSFEAELPNITIIYGENGRGKTGMFRALMFGLFDDRRLPQDEGIESKQINLVNKQMLTEREGEEVIASVTVTLSANGFIYEVCRKVLGIMRNEQITEQPYGVSLSITDEHGNTKPAITDPVEVGEVIGKVFDPKIKDYFLFDGEKIERLTRADVAQRKTVSQGIKNLLNINDLEIARRGMEILRSKLTQEAGKSSNGDLPKILRAIDSNEKEIERNTREREHTKDNLEQANNHKKKLDEELDKIDAIKDLLAKRRDYMNQEADIQESQERRIGLLGGKISATALALLQRSFQRVYSNLDEKKDAGEIPVQDKLELIKKILTEHKCICGSCIKAGTPEYNAIMEWQAKIFDSGLSDEALNVWRDLSTLRQIIPTTIADVQRNLTDYEKDKRNLDAIQEKLKNLSENINDGAEEKARNFNRQREECLTSIGNYQEQLRALESEASRLANEKDFLANEKERIIQKEGVKNELLAASNLASDTYRALDEIFQSFTLDMKKQIGDQASKIMHSLLDKEGRYSLKSIVVNEDYSLQVNDHRDEPFLANISAGQRQIISLCFITALAQVANGTERFEIPLFMDTPFGRLSFEHRNNLIKFIPQICQQWITMVTDTELTEDEWSVYQSSGYKCSFYKLQSQSDGTTQIFSIPLEDVTQAIMKRRA